MVDAVACKGNVLRPAEAFRGTRGKGEQVNEELNRIAVALESIADYLLVGLIAEHGDETLQAITEMLNTEGETE